MRENNLQTDTPPPHVAPLTGYSSLGAVAALFLKMGFTAFGGPAAHIALFHDEVVKRRRWLTEEHFLDMLGATNLIPGPNSTEMAIHIGYARAGWRGLIVAGLCFILPAALIVLVFAWLYKQYGATPTAEWLLYGIKPIIIAIVLQAVVSLSLKAVKNGRLAIIGGAAFVLYLLGFNEILLLFGGGLAVLLLNNTKRVLSALRGSTTAATLISLPALTLAQGGAVSVPVSLGTLFLTFLKIGAVLYGSGYVLLAFLRNDFVNRLGWLTNQQLLDAVAVGQFTPGPVFTAATFVGYLVSDLPGAVAATIGIFLPSFIFVALINPLIPRLRHSTVFSSLLDGINVASLGLMAAVALQLGQAAIVDWLTVLLAVASAVLLLRYKVNSTWLIVGGGIIGVLSHLPR